MADQMHLGVTKVHYLMFKAFSELMNTEFLPRSLKFSQSHRKYPLEMILLRCSDAIYLSFQIVSNRISVINLSVIQVRLKSFAFGSINFVGPIHFCFYCHSDFVNFLLPYFHRFSFQLIHDFCFCSL